MKSSKQTLFYLFSFILILVTIATFSGCMADKVNISEGITYFKSGDYDKSIAFFEARLKENPNNNTVRIQLFRSKLKAYFTHLSKAREYRKFKKKSEALQAYQKALKVFPDNFNLVQEIKDYEDDDKRKSHGFKSKIKPPVSLLVDPKETIGKINLRSVPITKIFKAVGDTFEVNFIFDKDFKDFIYSLDIKNTGFYQLLDQLCMISNSEYRILNPTTVLVYPNQRYKKKQFQLKGVKVFYLSNAKAEDAKKLLMTLFRDQQILVQDDAVSNTLIVKAAYLTLKEIERFIAKIDKPKSEVAIDIEIMEIRRDIINKLGLDFGTSISAGVSAGIDDGSGTISPTMKFSKLKDTGFYITLPSAAMSFLESSTNSKILAKPNLRGINDEKIVFKIGEKIPIQKVVFQSVAAGGANNIPTSSYEYRDVGIRIEITPFIHNNGDISMQLDLNMDFISSYIDTFPILGNRELKNFIRLKSGETSIIGGFIKDEIRKSVQGLPVLSKIPILGKLFGVDDDIINQTDVIFSITPRIIRKVDISESDDATVWSNMSSGTSAGSSRSIPTSRAGNRTGRKGPNRLVISPSRRQITAGRSAIFTVRFSATEDISNINFDGTVSGGKAEIENIRTSFFQGKKDVSVFDNISGNSFNLGYTFNRKNMRGNTLAQIKVKFLEKGEYKIVLGSVSCMAKNRSQVELDGNSATVIVK